MIFSKQNCSVKKGIGNISNTGIKASTIAGGIGIQYGVKHTKTLMVLRAMQ